MLKFWRLPKTANFIGNGGVWSHWLLSFVWRKMAYQATGPAHGSHVDSNCLVAWLKKHSSLHSLSEKLWRIPRRLYHPKISQGGSITSCILRRCERKLRFIKSCRISRSLCQSCFFGATGCPADIQICFIAVYIMWFPAYPSIWYIEPMRKRM